MSKVWNLIFGLPLMHERWDKGGLPLEMASKVTYECFVCKKNGFPDTRVFLDGKDENGKTIYKNEDMTAHQHKQKQNNVTSDSKIEVTSNYQQSGTSQQPQQSQEHESRGMNAATQAQVQDSQIAEILSKLQGLSDQISHLTKLVYAQTQQQEQQHV